MGRNAWLLGFSASRLLAGGMFVTLLALVGYGLIRSLSGPDWLARTVVWLDSRLQRVDILLGLVLALVYLPLFVSGVVALRYTPGFDGPSSFQAVYDRFQPILFGLAVVSVQAALVLLVGYAQMIYRRPERALSRVPLVTLLVLLLLSTTVAHWVILALRVPLFQTIPGWYWKINNKGFGLRDLLFIGLAVLLLAFAGYVLRHPRRVRSNLAGLMLLAYLLQIGIGFIEGQGFESLRRRYADSFHGAYAYEAVRTDDSLAEIVSRYESRYGQMMFLSTKPPGVLLVYVLFERAANAFYPLVGEEARYQRLTMLIAMIFPLLATLALPLIYLFGRRFAPVDDPQILVIFYMALPGIVLFAQYLDQMLYPSLFLGGVGLVSWAVRSRPPWPGLLVGVFLYLAIFVVFSMLGLIAFMLALLGLDLLFAPASQVLLRRVLGVVGKGSLILGGALLVGLLFYFGLSYHIDTRYQVSMRIVKDYDFYERVDRRPQEGLSPFALWLSHTRQAALLNNVEFAAGVGFPVFWLFVTGAVICLAGFARDPAQPQRRVLVALLATFVGLNLFGQMRGEAARLWLMWAPMFVTFAATAIHSVSTRWRNPIVLGVLAMELVTVFLTYKFQDLVM